MNNPWNWLFATGMVGAFLVMLGVGNNVFVGVALTLCVTGLIGSIFTEGKY